MWLIFLLWSWLMAGKGPTALIFSAGERSAWQQVSANGQILGTVHNTPCETPAGCYGMGRLQDGSIWVAAERHFYTFNPSLTIRSGGIAKVETIAGQSGRHLYRIVKGPKVSRKPLEHAAFLEEIDPRRWTVTRSWHLPGTYRSFGLGSLAVNLDESVAYYSKETTSGTIHRHALTSDAVLPDLVVSAVGSGGLIVLNDGSVVVGYRDGARRFSPAGELLHTYEAGALRAGQGLVTHGADGSSFWVQGFAEDAVYSTLYEFGLDGTIRHQWNTPANGVKWDAPFVDPPASGDIIVVTSSTVGELRAYDALTGALLITDTSGLSSSSSDLRLSTDGTKVFASDGDAPSHIEENDASTLALLSANALTISSSLFAVDTSGNFYVRDNFSNVLKYDASYALVWSRAHEVGYLEVSPDGSRLYSATLIATPNVINVYDTVGDVFLTDLATLPADEVVVALCRDISGNIYAVSQGNGAGFSGARVYKFTPTGTQVWMTEIYPINGGTGIGDGLSTSRDGNRVWVRSTIPGAAIISGYNTSDGSFISSIDGTATSLSSGRGIAITGETTMACPDPCADAGIGEPYLALAAEQNTTLFYDRAWNFIASISTPYACALAPDSRGVWIAMDNNAGSDSILYLVDPSTIDTNTNEPTILLGPYTTAAEDGTTPVRIAELGGFHALFVLSCNRLLTSDRTTHELIEVCLPNETTGTALVAKRYSLVVDPLDAQLVDSGKNLLYLDGGSAKVWNLKNDALLRTIGSVGGGTWPVVLTDNTWLVRDGNEILRYKRTGALFHRWNWVDQAPSVSLSRLYGLAADIQTDVCACGNKKDGAIFIPGETPATGITLSLLDSNALEGEGGFEGPPQATYIIPLTDVVDGGIDTASAFVALNAIDTGAGFSDQSGAAVRRPTPNRHCGPETRLTTVTPNPGCNAGGKGWTPTYTGASGVVPTCTDPPAGETLTGKDSFFPIVSHRHTTRPSGSVQTIRTSVVELDDTERKEGRIKSVADVDVGFSDAQGNWISSNIAVDFYDNDGNPYAAMLGDATRKYFQRDELVLTGITDIGRRTSATPVAIGRGIVDRYPYGQLNIFGLKAIDRLIAEGGGFSPDKRMPQYNIPLTAYPDAPPDLARLPLPVIFGEVSDEGAINPITGLPNSRGKVPVRYVGMDVLGTAPGGEAWGRFLICGHAVYSIIALYGSDCGGLGLYGTGAVASVLAPAETEDEDAPVAGTTEQTVISGLTGDLSGVATDGNAQIVVFATSGRTELQINAVDDFAKTVTVDGNIDPDLVQGVPWYISSIDYVPRRVKIDLATRNGVDVQVPTHAGYIKATSYTDISSPEGDFRTTEMYATGVLLLTHLIGEITLAVNVVGLEDQGDGSGLPITEFFTAYNFFFDNFIHRQLRKPVGGLWAQVEADVPLWSNGYSMTKQSTFRAMQDQTVTELGGVGLEISAYFGEGISTRDADQLFQNNGHCRAGSDEHGRTVVWRFNPFEDSSAWPRLDHVSQVFGDISFDTALDEAMNWVRGGCDWDADAGEFREDDMKAVSQTAITRNEDIPRYSKHYDGKLIAKTAHFQNMLNRVLAMHQDGPQYVTIQNCHMGAWDLPCGSGILFTSQFGPSATGWVDQPLIVLRKSLHADADSVSVSLLCLNVGPGSAPGDSGSDSLLIPSSQQFILTNNVSGPTLSNTLSIAPVLAA